MGLSDPGIRSHLKKVFSSDIGVEASPQVLDILEYACGLILGLALFSTENPNFEMAPALSSVLHRPRPWNHLRPRPLLFGWKSL